VLLPDLLFPFFKANDSKWDGKTFSSLYLVAILRRPDISSIRDLNTSHLRHIGRTRNQIIKATCEKWPEIQPDQLRLYFHCIFPYPPV
jgi:m7GpppX diphosphatase